MIEKIKTWLGKVPVKVWLYAAAFVALFVAVALPLKLTGTETIWYSLFWGVFAGVAGLIAVRTIYHAAKDDNSAEMWAVSIYALIADLGWLLGILSVTYVEAIIGIVIMMAFTMMALGTRYLGKDGWKKRQMDAKDLLFKTLRYRLMGDVIGGAIDTNRLLVDVTDGSDPMTINEAKAAGYKAEAMEAEEYIKEVLKNSFGKEA